MRHTTDVRRPARGAWRASQWRWIAILTGTLLIGCHGKKEEGGKGGAGGGKGARGPAVVDIRVVKPRAVTDTVEAAGTILAIDQVQLRPEATGRLTALTIAEGQRVAKGTVVARVNDADLRAQLAKTQANLELARKSVERLQKLLAVQGVNQADYDLAVAQVRSSEADADYTRALIEKTVVRAPFAGVIGLRQVSPGAYVTPTTILATLQREDQLKVDFTLPEAYADRAPVGANVVVTTGSAGTKGQQYTATVAAREPEASATTRNLTARAVLPAGTRLAPGTFVRVRLAATGADARQTGVLLPTNALLFADRSDQVLVVRGGKAQPVDVQTGPRTADQITILGGLKTGDSVIVTGVLFAQPGKPVKVRKVTSDR